MSRFSEIVFNYYHDKRKQPDSIIAGVTINQYLSFDTDEDVELFKKRLDSVFKMATSYNDSVRKQREIDFKDEHTEFFDNND